MKMMMKVLKYPLLAAGILSAACAHGETGVTDTHILLGQSAPFTGTNAQLGIKYLAGAKVYFDFVNEQGGVYGRKIVVDSEDDGYNPDLTGPNTVDLIDNKHVFALFGYVGTPTSKKAIPIATAKHVPFFAPFSGAQSIRKPYNRYVFNLRASYCDEVDKSVAEMGVHAASNLAVVYQDDAYGEDVLACVNQALLKIGAVPVAKATIARNSLDTDKAVATLTKAQPVAVMVASGYQATAKLIKQLRKETQIVNYFNVSFVGASALAQAMGGNTGRGVVIPQVVPPPGYDSSEEGYRFRKIIRDDTNVEAYEGFLAAKAFVVGLRRAGPNLTREAFMKALESKEIDLGAMFVDYSDGNHSGSPFVQTTMITYGGRRVW